MSDSVNVTKLLINGKQQINPAAYSRNCEKLAKLGSESFGMHDRCVLKRARKPFVPWFVPWFVQPTIVVFDFVQQFSMTRGSKHVATSYIGFYLGLPSGMPDCHNKNRHNSIKKIVRDSILSTYCSQSRDESFVPIWMARENVLLLHNVPISEIYQLDFGWWPSACFICRSSSISLYAL
jgi:hypothetical protein